MRKQLLYYSFISLLLLSACEKDKTTDFGEGQDFAVPEVVVSDFICFSAEKYPLVDINNEEAAGEAFAQDDVVSVYAWTGAYDEDNFIADNLFYKCNADGVFCPAAETDTIKWKNDTDNHYFISIYPKREEPVDLRNFNFTDSDKDILVATLVGEDAVIPSSDTINLPFRRLLTKVNVNISLEGKLENGTVNSVTFKDVASVGSMDFVTQKLSASESKTDKPLSLENDVYTAEIIPQNFTSIVAEISGTVYGEIKKFSYDGSIDFQAGYIYNITFTPVGDDELQIVSVDMLPWTDGGELGDGVLFPQGTSDSASSY